MPGDALLIGIAQLGIVVAGLVLGSLTVYALALCVQLSVSAISFYSLVSTATGSSDGA